MKNSSSSIILSSSFGRNNFRSGLKDEDHPLFPITPVKKPHSKSPLSLFTKSPQRNGAGNNRAARTGTFSYLARVYHQAAPFLNGKSSLPGISTLEGRETPDLRRRQPHIIDDPSELNQEERNKLRAELSPPKTNRKPTAKEIFLDYFVADSLRKPTRSPKSGFDCSIDQPSTETDREPKNILAKDKSLPQLQVRRKKMHGNSSGEELNQTMKNSVNKLSIMRRVRLIAMEDIIKSNKSYNSIQDFEKIETKIHPKDHKEVQSTALDHEARVVQIKRDMLSRKNLTNAYYQMYALTPERRRKVVDNLESTLRNKKSRFLTYI